MLVPGLNGVGAFWARQIPDFARDFRVVVHDHRGTGQSTHSRIRYSVEQMAADVLRLMDRLGIASAHLVGHSTGGAIGQVIAQDHPDRLQSLVLSATWPGPDPYFRPLFYSRELADGVPGAKLVVLDGGGHFVPNIFPDQYNATVGGFLRSLIGR